MELQCEAILPGNPYQNNTTCDQQICFEIDSRRENQRNLLYTSVDRYTHCNKNEGKEVKRHED